MPHFVIEYSANLEPDVDLRAVVDAVHRTAVESGLFKVGGIRVRTLRHDLYKVGDGNPENAFLHVRVAILEGRSVENRERLGNAAIAAVDAERAASVGLNKNRKYSEASKSASSACSACN